MKNMPSRYSALFVLCLPMVLFGQTDPVKQVDAIFQTWNNTSGPGAAVSVIEDGRVILEKGYGLANSTSNSGYSARRGFCNVDVAVEGRE